MRRRRLSGNWEDSLAGKRGALGADRPGRWRSRSQSRIAFPEGDGNNRGMNIKTPATLAFFLTAACAFAAEQQIGYQDTPIIPGTKWHVHDGDRPQPPIVKPGAK